MKLKKIIVPILVGTSIIGIASCRNNDTPSGSSDISNDQSSSSASSSSGEPDYMGAALTELAVGAGSAKTSYSLGEKLNCDGIFVTAIFADSQKRNLTSSQYSIDDSEFRSDKEGVYNIHVIYKQGTIRKTATYTVTVSSILNKLSTKYLLGITASGMKLDYMFGESLDTNGLKVTATYSDFSEEDVTSKVTSDYSLYDSSRLGAYMLKFNYEETYTLGNQTETKSSSTFLLATVDGKIKDIEFESGTTTVEQDSVGPDGTLSTLDMSDWKVKATFINNDYDEVSAYVSPSELVLSDFNSGIAGKQSATISYTHGTMTRSCKVEINVSSIAEPDYFFNASTLTQANNTTLAEETVISDVLSAGNKCQIKDESTPKEFGDLSFSKRIQTNGAGKPDVSNYIKFTLTSDATVAIIARASSTDKPVTAAGFYDSNMSLKSDSYQYSTNISKYKYELKAGTYYFCDVQYAVQIYGIQIWYK